MQKVVVPLVAVLCLGFMGFIGYLFMTGNKKPQQQVPVVAQAPPVVQQQQQQPARPASGPQVGQLAPDILGQDVDGKEFKLSDYRGKIVVLDFWGFW